MNHPALTKLKEFEHLTDGWCHGEGVAIERDVLISAGDLLASMARGGFDSTDVFPGLSGEVRVTAYHKKHYLEFTIELPEDITFLHEFEQQEMVWLEHLSQDQAFSLVLDYSSKLKPDRFPEFSICSQELFTSDFGTRIEAAFSPWHSNRPGVRPSPLSKTTVLSKPVVQFATTFTGFTLRSAASRPSIGFSTQLGFPQISRRETLSKPQAPLVMRSVTGI
ncbi:MAG: hypothetical protein HQL51_05925 [Magnetococcales bacterium]|nr:hypothetical protein [Magnetococcales bacterium]